jgi:hypothetical protein
MVTTIGCAGSEALSPCTIHDRSLRRATTRVLSKAIVPAYRLAIDIASRSDRTGPGGALTGAADKGGDKREREHHDQCAHVAILAGSPQRRY